MIYKTIKNIAGLSVIGLCFMTNAHAAGTLVSSSIPFAKDSNVRKAVIDECKLETKLPNFIKEAAVKEGVAVTLTSKNIKKSKGKALFVETTFVHASGGGPFSGPKSVSVAGKLYKNGKLTSKFTATRFSGGGMFGAYKGTCAIVGRCAKTLGSDIAKWLKNPVNDAHLGD